MPKHNLQAFQSGANLMDIREAAVEEKEPYVDFTAEMEKVDHLIKGIPVAMLTFLNDTNKLCSFPLLTQDLEFDGSLWFLISKNSAKLQDLRKHGDVNLSYSNKHKCVSINGTIELTEDRDLTRELWQKPHEAWFPEGPQDPAIQLLKVHVHTVEYWESHTSPIYKMIQLVRTALGQPTSKESHSSFDLKH
ncbi:pyridoxamine 5'-phosphate oxidase family protein [Bdellovibrio bacteriovorus]|uniref:pyridoxamine 5'-phosphate oxidase family protein n=1 Tax=Bdellovibrio bacteriovorus TaxID=959 RepID=UPI0035A6826F